MRHATGLAVALALLLTGAPRGAWPEDPPPSEAEQLAERYASWIRQLDSARTRIEQARRGYEGALASLQDQKQRRYPRGKGKRELEQAVEEARAALREAEAALPELLEQARRAGVPPGVTRPYEGSGSRS